MISQRLSHLRNVLIIELPSVESFQVEFSSRSVIPGVWNVGGLSESSMTLLHPLRKNLRESNHTCVTLIKLDDS